MFGSFPRLLDRDFLIGFYLPATVLVIGLVALSAHYGWLSGETLWGWAQEAPFLATAIAAILIWLVSATFLAFNGWILRIKEGYPFTRVLSFLTVRRQREFDRRHRRVEELKSQIRQLKESKSADDQQKLQRAIHEWIKAGVR